jgi:hypothetical protein
MSLRLAIVAVTVSPRAGTPLVLGYIAPSAALIVGVMYLLVGWFLGFIDGVIRTDSSHWSWPPVKDLGTPKVRPMREGQRYTTRLILRISFYRCLADDCFRNFHERDDANEGCLFGCLFLGFLLWHGRELYSIPSRDAETACATGCVWWYNGLRRWRRLGESNTVPAGTADYKSAPGTDQLASRRLHSNGNEVRSNAVTVGFLWRTCGERCLMVGKKRKTVQKRTPHKKVKVSKAAFDAVLEKLIQSKPVKRA